MPWRQSVIESDPDLDDDQMAIVFLDCYPVHMGEEFQCYIWDKFPFIILCFVPVNCEMLMFIYEDRRLC